MRTIPHFPDIAFEKAAGFFRTARGTSIAVRHPSTVTMRSTKRAYDRRHRSETPRILQWPHDHLCGWLEATMTDKMIHRYLEALAVVATIALFPACSSKRATDV